MKSALRRFYRRDSSAARLAPATATGSDGGRLGCGARFALPPSLEVSRPAVGHFIFVVVVTVVTDDYVPARADAFDGSLLRNGSRRATESRKPDGANFPALRLAK
ncbi:unnamed protein product [Lampetra fluviatilis]